MTELPYFNPLVKLTSTLTFSVVIKKIVEKVTVLNKEICLVRYDQKPVDLFLTEVRPLGVMGKGITIELEWILVMIIAATEGKKYECFSRLP